MKKIKSMAVFGIVFLSAMFGMMILPNLGFEKVSPVTNVQGAWNGTAWTGPYSDVMNATQDIFNLYGDIGSLLGQNIGNTLSATIQLFIYSILVIMPFAIVFGVVITAIMMVKGKAGKLKSES